MIHFKDITIPNPCSVEYDALPGDDIKRFCSNCEKHVYDFRGKDEIYLNEVFSTTGKVCGIYYEDQIQKSSLKIQRPFHYALATKIVSILLFVKTFFSIYDAKASVQKIYQTTIQVTDSLKLKTVFNGKEKSDVDVEIDIYVNGKFEHYSILQNNNSIYLSDSIKPTDKIKLVITTTRYYNSTSSNKQNSKKHLRNKDYYTTEQEREYNFNFSKSNKITVKINYHKMLNVFRRKRKYIMGAICPANFW